MKSCVYSSRPAPHEGRFAIVTNVGWQDAMDALPQLTNAAGADGEIVWS
jgi:3-deoxy-D-arabino-heptulosonate 7-phosphate (DAHP) synthase class II